MVGNSLPGTGQAGFLAGTRLARWRSPISRVALQARSTLVAHAAVVPYYRSFELERDEVAFVGLSSRSFRRHSHYL